MRQHLLATCTAHLYAEGVAKAKTEQFSHEAETRLAFAVAMFLVDSIVNNEGCDGTLQFSTCLETDYCEGQGAVCGPSLESFPYAMPCCSRTDVCARRLNEKVYTCQPPGNFEEFAGATASKIECGEEPL